LFRRIMSIMLSACIFTGSTVAFAASDLFADVPEATISNTGDAPVMAGAEYDSTAYVVNTQRHVVDTGTLLLDNYPKLENGDKDGADEAFVVMLQNRLYALGFLQSSADGIFGGATETAVSEFQRLNGLPVTGVADNETQRLLYSDMNSLTLPTVTNNIAYGAEAARVQSRLAEWGFLTGDVDGVLGEDSETAISRFKRYVIKYEDVTPSPAPTATPSPSPTPTPPPDELPDVEDVRLATPVPEGAILDGDIDDLVRSFVNGDVNFEIYRHSVQNGDRSDEVGRVQSRLKQLGYLYPDPDGSFGDSTELALKYFQRKNGLAETGIADEYTQRVLFSATAQRSEDYVTGYKLYVDISDQKVYAFAWNGSNYSTKVRTMVCSTGKDGTPTPMGTYHTYGRMSDEWYYFPQYNCYAKWAVGIVGGILFHSITFDSSKHQVGSEASLGRKASHGCIRLKIEDAKWIWDNCLMGTTVVIQP